jgi:hypothetical protein
VIRRALALAGAAVVAVGVSTLSTPGPASADPVVVGDLVIQEVAAELVDAGSDNDIDGGFAQLVNTTNGSIDASGLTLTACNTTASFSVTIPASTTIPAGGSYLVGDPAYNPGLFGPTPDRTFGSALEQIAGGVILKDGSTPLDDIQWGDPHIDCSGLTEAGVTPDNQRSINRGNPWFLQTPSPESLTS